MEKKKDAFEEAVEILKSYQEGLPPCKPESCCSSCECEEEEKKDCSKAEKTYCEAEF